MNSIREVSNPRRKPMMINYKSCGDNSRQITILPHRVRIFHFLSKKKEETLVRFGLSDRVVRSGGRMDGGEERSLVSVSVTKIFGWTESWPRVSRA